ncbi:hypothetical protein DS891_07060 [Pseudoalteromonas sp. JC28]|uniref:hypothetical protein n=1 Tax=Pseudoalteromonas sp. JC28 TaxID=2267617 RepID=UPI0015722824|nr:hypothetical protein [Pseudoalteromonas sp. JC28]NSY33357.1 hypothetical protein [Pseudoalteromonas sp. JC28]
METDLLDKDTRNIIEMSVNELHDLLKYHLPDDEIYKAKEAFITAINTSVLSYYQKFYSSFIEQLKDAKQDFENLKTEIETLKEMIQFNEE